MYREPWAKFTTRVTPKITVSPAAIRKSEDALASPVRNWTRMKPTVRWPDLSGGRTSGGRQGSNGGSILSWGQSLDGLRFKRWLHRFSFELRSGFLRGLG